MQTREIDKDFEDLCFKSIKILQLKVEKYLLKEHGIQDAWYPDTVTGTNKQEFNNKMDIVLFGNFISRILESGCWPISEARFWVLSHSVKEVLVRAFKLPPNSIKVIQRNKLFHVNSKKRPFEKKMTFISGSRISETKNIESYLYVVSKLQIDYQMDITPVLSGDFDNMSNIYSMKHDSFCYRKRIEKIINKLPWVIRPIIREGLDPEEWLNQNDHSPVFVSFSTFIGEDFGVSLAQAQEKGWPSIISNWGGHRDVQVQNTIKVPSEYLLEDSGSYELLESRANLAAKYISENLDKINSTKQLDSVGENLKHEFIDIPILDNLRREFIKNNSSSSLYLCRGQINKFRALEESNNFFSDYHLEFGGIKLDSFDTIVIINDMSDQINGVTEFCNKLLSSELELNRTVRFIPLNKVLKRNSIDQMKNAGKIVIPFAKTSMESFFYFLNNILGSKEFDVYYGNEWPKNTEIMKVGKWHNRNLL
jgi:hypothetical protein